MKRNVDLTLEREFRDEYQRKIRKKLCCEECGKPIQIPWKYFCLSCANFFESVRIKRVECCWQLKYYERRPVKCSFHNQLHTPRWYYSKDQRKKCRIQLTGIRPSWPTKKTFRQQLGI